MQRSFKNESDHVAFGLRLFNEFPLYLEWNHKLHTRAYWPLPVLSLPSPCPRPSPPTSGWWAPSHGSGFSSDVTLVRPLFYTLLKITSPNVTLKCITLFYLCFLTELIATYKCLLKKTQGLIYCIFIHMFYHTWFYRYNMHSQKMMNSDN